MKKSVRWLFLFFFLTNLAVPGLIAQDLPELIAIRELDLRPETNEIVFQNYYNQWCRNIREHTKGVSAWIMKGDRGNRIGKYNMIWGFNYVETRDYYFPVSDITNYPKWNAALSRFKFQAPEEPLVEDINEYTDFIVTGYDKMVNPQLGEVISVCFPEVKAGAEEKLEAFAAEELNVAFQNNIDGYYVYLLKGDRGSYKGKYAILRVFDSYERRRLYFPDDSNSPSPAFTKESKKVSGTIEKFKTYFETAPTGNSSDFILLY